MKKGLCFVLAALFSTQLIADDISGGPRINIQSGLLTIPCVKVYDPESAFDQRSFDVRLKQSGDSFELIFAEEEDPEVCEALIEASLIADKDTSDVDGNNGSTATPVTYKIGDRGPAGGIVFFVLGEDLHGLEAAPVDQGPALGAEWGAEWGCADAVILGADGTEVGTGAQNTTDILAAVCATPGIAAHLAANYSLNGFKDWFLPSKDELNLMYTNLYRKDLGGFAPYPYWSSSEDGINYAWGQIFGDGFQNGGSKDLAIGVRAVRAF